MSIVQKLEKNQVYSILMNDWDDKITGVFIEEAKEWILVHDNQNDFFVDGLRFVNKTNIDEVLREDYDIFKEKIFSKKYSKLSFDSFYTLESTAKLLAEIKNENRLLYFDTDNDEEIIVGKIESINEDSFTLKTLTTYGEWGENILCHFSELSSIAIKNDYLTSLSLLID